MKTFEELLQDNPSAFSQLVNELMTSYFGNIIIFNGEDDTTLFMSDSVARDLGCRAEDMVGKSKYLFQSEAYTERFVSDKVKSTGNEQFWSVRALKTGNIQYVSSVPVYDRDGKLRLVINRSMSERYLNNFIQVIQNEREDYERKYDSILKFVQQQNSVPVIANSPAMQEVLRIAQDVAQSDASILLTGEPGVGKEVVARFIYQNSARADAPFIPVNCSAIPKELVESEFFGYEHGAFTGAQKGGHAGLFELANSGTLFLDELGEMPLSIQPKLLRALDSNEIQRVGGTNSIKTDVRIISATNRNLEALIDEKLFREDLYYRLNVIPIYIPPLRERKEDIPALSTLFLDMHNRKYSTSKQFSIELLDKIIEYPWPGNVRELRNFVSRIAITSKGNVLHGDLLPETNRGNALYSELRRGQEQAHIENVGSPDMTGQDYSLPLKEAVQAYEKKYVQTVLKGCGGNISKAAKKLGIHRTAVYRKLKGVL